MSFARKLAISFFSQVENSLGVESLRRSGTTCYHLSLGMSEVKMLRKWRHGLLTRKRWRKSHMFVFSYRRTLAERLCHCRVWVRRWFLVFNGWTVSEQYVDTLLTRDSEHVRTVFGTTTG